ncbi:hypothetical protein Vadar_010590 [Vaccinium darrowii]|uniref:Uncharacterized protein n=1 Tax=Vaccinium darrowii TaxID=229202 RepID=A0ACB7XZN7_9ERIC|nr:hypothetical protein Vadar_010590 [Vaccinium darrowii]
MRYLNGGTLLSIVLKENPVEDIDISSAGLNIEDLALLGPCNGIVCLTRLGVYSPIVLCNPSMKEFRVLPEPSDKKFFSRDYFVISGYGFDPSTNDCKVVKFGFHGPDFVTSVLVFRMTDEVFDEIPLPEVSSMEHTSANELFILGDSLALARWMFPMGLFSMEKLFDIWVMDEKGAEVYWTKKFTIGPLEVDFPLGFPRNGEFVFESSGGRIMSCHIDTQQTKEYQVCVHRPQRCYLVGLEVLLYTESLVSIKRHNERDGHDDSFAYLSRLWSSLFSTE